MNKIIANGTNFDESLQVSTITDKLPPSWKDCRKELKQKTDVMNLCDLVYLQVEENFRILDHQEEEKIEGKKKALVGKGKRKSTYNETLQNLLI